MALEDILQDMHTTEGRYKAISFLYKVVDLLSAGCGCKISLGTSPKPIIHLTTKTIRLPMILPTSTQFEVEDFIINILHEMSHAISTLGMGSIARELNIKPTFGHYLQQYKLLGSIPGQNLQLFHKWFNCLEDVRIEHYLFRYYPRIKNRFKENIRAHYLRTNELELSINNPLMTYYMLSDIGCNYQPDFFDSLNISERFWSSINSPKEFLNLVVDLYEHDLKQQEQLQQIQQKNKSPEEETISQDICNAFSGISNESENTDGNEPNSENECAEESQENEGETLCESSNECTEESQENEGETSCESSNECAEESQEVGSEDISDWQNDPVAQILMNKITGYGDRNNTQTVEVKELDERTNPDLKTLKKMNMVRPGRSLAARIKSVLVSNRRKTWVMGQKSGRISDRDLPSVAIGNCDIFKRRKVVNNRGDIDLAISVLVDVSYSMVGIIDTALQSSSMMCEALNFLGIPFSMHYFSNDVYQVKDINTPWGFIKKKNRYSPYMGNTYTEKALAVAHKELSTRPESRKLIVLATDGSPKNLQTTLDLMDMIRANGIEIFVIGIFHKGGKMPDSFESHAECAGNIPVGEMTTELATKLRKYL